MRLDVGEPDSVRMAFLEPFVVRHVRRLRLGQILAEHEPPARPEEGQCILEAEVDVADVIEHVDEDDGVEGARRERRLLDWMVIDLDEALALGSTQPAIAELQVLTRERVTAHDACGPPPVQDQAGVRIGAAAQLDVVPELVGQEGVAVKAVPPPAVPVVTDDLPAPDGPEKRSNDRVGDPFPAVARFGSTPEGQLPFLRSLPARFRDCAGRHQRTRVDSFIDFLLL